MISRVIRWVKHPETLMLAALGVCIAALVIVMTLLFAILLGWLVPAAA